MSADAARHLRTDAEREHARQTLARTPKDAPYADYLRQLLDDTVVLPHPEYVAGLEAEVAELRKRAGGAR